MHQIVLLTALTATTGLFGGGRHARVCGRGGCATPAYTAYAPSYGCQPGSACAAPVSYQAPAYAAPQAAPAPAPQATAPRTAYYYPSYYYPTAPTCASGNCPRR